MKKVIVVGGGASGMMAAITAAREGASVVILERMEKPGKKLLITGNGRCNLTNKKASNNEYYRGGTSLFIKDILEGFTPEDTISFFHGLGLLIREREDLIYPYTDQASSVLELLQQEMKRLKIKLKSREEVRKIQRTEEGFLVETDTWKYEGHKVILCAGGQAAPQTGSNGSGYGLARSCGHSLAPVQPALVPLKAKGELPKLQSGTRNFVTLALQVGDTFVAEEKGELQWTDYGVSGIVVFQVSRYAADALREKQKVRLHIDLMPEYTKSEILTLLQKKERQMKAQTWEELLNGLLKKKNITALTRLVKRKPSDKIERELFDQLVLFIKEFSLEISGTKDFDMAQVCAGGVPVQEVDQYSLESKKMPGLYLAGELLDIDGTCGGYNLQWAWASGYRAGYHAGKGEV